MLIAILGQSQCADNFMELTEGVEELRVIQFPLKGLPLLIEDDDIIPQEIMTADIVLDYTGHPQIPYLLDKAGKVFTTSPASSKNVIVVESFCTAEITNRFGLPGVEIKASNGIIERVDVLRSAPCGSTYEAAKMLAGIPIKEASQKAGLFVQFHCTGSQRAIHAAANVHSKAVEMAIAHI